MSTQISSQDTQCKLSDLIHYYEVCNKAEGKSQKTISWYSANLNRFRRFVMSRHLPESLEKIDIQLLREYVLYLLKQNRFDTHPYTPAKTEPLSSATIHGHVRTLRAFFKWLIVEGLTQNNPAIKLKPPKVVRKVVSTLSDEEIRAILSTFGTSHHLMPGIRPYL